MRTHDTPGLPAVTRRAALWAIPVAIALSADALALPGPTTRPPALALIESHRAAYAAYRAADDVARALLDQLPPCRVLLSRAMWTHEPYYGWSAGAINSHFHNLPRGLFPRREESRAAKLAELATLQAEYDRLGQQIGWPAADAKADEAMYAEDEAMAALVAYRPLSADEVFLIAAYCVQHHAATLTPGEENHLASALIEAWAKIGGAA